MGRLGVLAPSREIKIAVLAVKNTGFRVKLKIKSEKFKVNYFIEKDIFTIHYSRLTFDDSRLTTDN